MFFDWVDCHQDFDFPLPLIGKRGYISVDLITGEQSPMSGLKHVHEGSFSTKLTIKVSGQRLSVSCNASRIDRLDNLFGFETVEDCINKYNEVISQYGLPAFTKCTKVWMLQGKDGSKATTVSDGCVITRLDCTSNFSVGKGNDFAFIKAMSTQPYGLAVPNLYANGNTVDWRNKAGAVMQDHHAKAYVKASEIRLHHLFKAVKKYGSESPEVKYLKSVIDYCADNGVVRFENEFKSGFLRKNHFAFYGLSDYSRLLPIHQNFSLMHQKMQVTAMTTQTIADVLLYKKIVETRHSANITAMYAINWAHGERYDLQKKQVQTHRARLRAVGIDIALPFDLTKFSVISTLEARTIKVRDLPIPSWYRMPEQARAA